MKKNKIALSLAAAMLFTGLAGCGKKNEDKPAVIDYTPVATMTDAENIMVVQMDGCVINELTGEWIDESLENQRPVCIMINNIIDAMPQSGISQADITYEMLVEGGITRYLCVFKDYSGIEKLGPVRSARHYYAQMADMYNGIYAHVGWSVEAEQYIAASGTNNLNGLYDSTTFYRDNDRVAPHNCYTNSESLKKGIEEAGYSTEYTKDMDRMFAFNYEDTPLENGMTANKVTTAYGSGSTRWYEYNEDEKLYYRFQYGEEQIDDQTQKQLAYKNLIIMFVQYSDIGGGLQSIDWNKGGAGFYVTDGEYTPIKWKNSNGVVKYYSEDGSQLKMNPGKTFITVFPENQTKDITFE